MARNLLCDHRIPKARLTAFAAASKLGSIREIEKALRDYREKEVCPLKESSTGVKSVPAFARPENAGNSVKLGADATLATVLVLSWLGKVFAAARSDFKMPEFQRFELGDTRNVGEVNEKLSDYLADSSAKRGFLRAILAARNRYQRSRLEKKICHTWAAEWSCLKDFMLPGRPEQWLKAVGVPTETPVWVAVVRYPVRRARSRVRLFRPTQLDAGWYAHHFPSPPQAPLESGGHTMFLHSGARDLEGYGLVNEYIHERLDFRMEDWEHAGGLLGFVQAAVSGDLDLQREKHLDLLEMHYRDGVRTWISENLNVDKYNASVIGL